MSNSDVTKFLSRQDPAHVELLMALHQIIESGDKMVKGTVGKMMGVDMVLYHDRGVFKYGLSPGGKHMSLHLMPIYGSSELHARYKKLLSEAKFQKGCINFTKPEQMPLPVVRKLLHDCSLIDLVALFNKMRAERKAK